LWGVDRGEVADRRRFLGKGKSWRRKRGWTGVWMENETGVALAKER
jgi:hypothetical protein